VSHEEDALVSRLRELEARVTRLEKSCPGDHSSASTEKPKQKMRQPKTSPQRPARTTASRSKKAPVESSTAGSTDGSGGADGPS